MPDLRPLLRAITRPSWGRVARAVAVVAFVGVFAVDCCNATGDWAWVDVTRAPHMAAVGGRAVTTAASPHRFRQLLALPVSAVSLLSVLVLVGLVRSVERTRRPLLRALGPPRRGPPSRRFASAPT